VVLRLVVLLNLICLVVLHVIAGGVHLGSDDDKGRALFLLILEYFGSDASLGVAVVVSVGLLKHETARAAVICHDSRVDGGLANARSVEIVFDAENVVRDLGTVFGTDERLHSDLVAEHLVVSLGFAVHIDDFGGVLHGECVVIGLSLLDLQRVRLKLVVVSAMEEMRHRSKRKDELSPLIGDLAVVDRCLANRGVGVIELRPEHKLLGLVALFRTVGPPALANRTRQL